MDYFLSKFNKECIKITFNKHFKISENNERDVKNLKKITQILSGTPISEATIINLALSEFFKNQSSKVESDYQYQLDLLKEYNLF